MAKSLVSIPTPNNGCIDCSLSDHISSVLEPMLYCKVKSEIVTGDEINAFPPWRPLVPVPEKREERTDIFNTCRNEGWNACVDRIVRGSRT